MSHITPLNNAPLGSRTGSQKTEYVALTDRSIKALKPSVKRRIVWAKGLPGFGVRISPSNTKSFVYKYDVDGKDRWMTLGRYPKMSLAEAMRLYSNARQKVERAEDPADQHLEKNKALSTSPTVNELIDAYIENYAKKHKRSWKEDQRILNKDIKPRWGRLKANALTPAMGKALLTEVDKRGSPIATNRTLAAGRKMFNWAINNPELAVQTSPFSGIEKPNAEHSRERFLSLDEVRQFWIKADDIDVNEITILASKFLLVTMQRVSEVAGIQMTELNLSAAAWTIPGSRTKNKRPHLVPLSKPALKIIKRVNEIQPNKEYLFSGRGKARHINRRSIQRAICDNLDCFGLDHFTAHDFRRTGSTLLGAFKVPRFDRERVLNHTDQSIGSVYDLYEYEDEKRAALNLWGDIIEHCAKSSVAINEKKLRSKLRYRDYFPD